MTRQWIGVDTAREPSTTTMTYTTARQLAYRTLTDHYERRVQDAAQVALIAYGIHVGLRVLVPYRRVEMARDECIAVRQCDPSLTHDLRTQGLMVTDSSGGFAHFAVADSLVYGRTYDVIDDSNGGATPHMRSRVRPPSEPDWRIKAFHSRDLWHRLVQDARVRIGRARF